MTLTQTTNSEPLAKEQKQLTDYLALITAERAEQQKRSKSPFRSKLTRIRAEKEVFRLDNEIEAKQRYLQEIQNSINQSNSK
jgi:hypothetical protein